MRIDLNEVIYFYRTKEEMSQKELGRCVGVSSSTIANYETGKSVPDIQTLANLIRVLKIPLEEIFSQPAEIKLKLYHVSTGNVNTCSAPLFKIYGCTDENYLCVKDDEGAYLLHKSEAYEESDTVIYKKDGKYVKEKYNGQSADMLLKYLGQIEDYNEYE